MKSLSVKHAVHIHVDIYICTYFKWDACKNNTNLAKREGIKRCYCKSGYEAPVPIFKISRQNGCL